MTIEHQDAPAVYILHENPEWLPALRTGLEAEAVPFRELELTSGAIDLGAEPPRGVFWSRLSASSHTRGNDHAKEYARAILRWLEAHGRRVVNGSQVLELEVSKVAQYTALAAAGFDVPKTVAVFGKDALSEKAREFELPFITKHNQGGKGLGVRRFESYEEFDAYVASDEFEEPIDGITLLQEYVVTSEPFITRAEFIGGKFHYAVRVDTSAGSFELCPAEACAVPVDGEAAPIELEDLTVATSAIGGFVTASAACEVPADSGLFRIRPEINAETSLIAKLEQFLADQRIEVAGIEFFETAEGRVIVYDINTNTNYNPDVEGTVELPGARAIARFLGQELESLHQPA